MVLISLSIEKNVYLPAGSVSPLSRLTSCNPAKSNLYFDSSFTTVMREPALYRLLTIHTPNFVSISLNLDSLSRESVPSPRPFVTFYNKLIFYGEKLLAAHTIPKLEDHTLSAVYENKSQVFSVKFLVSLFISALDSVCLLQ
jgi:hypothetical protein